jgi:hypothetical protein
MLSFNLITIEFNQLSPATLLSDSTVNGYTWRDPNPLRIDSTISVKLVPNELTQASVLSLSSYYPKLEPGVYSLRFRYREPNG